MSSACQGTSAVTTVWGGLRLPSFRTSVSQTFETGPIPLIATPELIIDGADAAVCRTRQLPESPNHHSFSQTGSGQSPLTPPLPTPTAKQVEHRRRRCGKRSGWGHRWGYLEERKTLQGFHRGRSWAGAQVLRQSMTATEIFIFLTSFNILY